MAGNKNSGVATAAAGPVTDAIAGTALEVALAASEKEKKFPTLQWPDGINDDEVLTIGQLREKLKVKDSLFAGVCAANQWRPGKQVSVKDFKKAAEAFCAAAMGKDEEKCSGT